MYFLNIKNKSSLILFFLIYFFTNFSSFAGYINKIDEIDKDKTYTIQCKSGANQGFGYLNGRNSTVKQAWVTKYSPQDMEVFTWSITPTKEGYFLLQVLSSGRYLNGRNKTVKEALVTDYNSEVPEVFMWSIIPSKKKAGYFLLKVKSSGRFLNGRNETETDVWVTKSDPKAWDCFRWRLSEVNQITESKIQSIIRDKYKIGSCSYRPADAHYQLLDTTAVTTIWKGSTLKKYEWCAEKFDCDDFAICLKAEVSKWMYTQEQEKPAGAAFGIMWAIHKKLEHAHAFNFYVTPKLEVLLIEPQTGDFINGTDYKKPHFVML